MPPNGKDHKYECRYRGDMLLLTLCSFNFVNQTIHHKAIKSTFRIKVGLSPTLLLENGTVRSIAFVENNHSNFIGVIRKAIGSAVKSNM